MRTIWKFPLGGGTAVLPPLGDPVPVFVGLDPANRGLCVWVEHEPDDKGAEQVAMSFVVRGTGHPVSALEVHVGSVVQGFFVWHVYQVVGE